MKGTYQCCEPRCFVVVQLGQCQWLTVPYKPAQWDCYAGEEENKPAVIVTRTKTRAKIYEDARVFHVLKAFGVYPCFSKVAKRAGVAKVIDFCCKPVAYLSFNDTPNE